MLVCRRWMIAMPALLGLACLGCSNDKMLPLGGTVTLDGTPIENGTISLAPAGGNGPTAEAIINAGKYSLKTLPGTKNVVIHGMKKVGTRLFHPEDPSSPTVDVTEETVPAKFNVASELTAEVKAGERTLDFKLTTDSP